ncbi:ATP-binding protein [Catenulispora subtropica]|uniref:Histidine kinase/HSP90-like ATPase domain-containing protein n=1 Tax=Catenulispora subtropica TaxID=450798 RepID=A0ABP5D3Q2_9ACTN
MERLNDGGGAGGTGAIGGISGTGAVGDGFDAEGVDGGPEAGPGAGDAFSPGVDVEAGVGERGTSVLEVGVDGVGIGDGAVPVTLRIPADRDFVVLVRSAAGHLGARAGFSMAEMQDWRLAVDEACGLLLLPDEVDATGEELECVFRLGRDGVGVTVSAEARPGSKPQVGGFGWSLLAALVDSLTWAEEGGRVRVDIVKRASGAEDGRRAEAR